MTDARGRVRCRARANGELRYLTPGEVAALVPAIYELLEEPALLVPEAELMTVAHTAAPKRSRAPRQAAS